MSTAINNFILATITTHPEKVGGNCPTFFAEDDQDLQEIAFSLEKILDGTAHEVKPGILIIVRHG